MQPSVLFAILVGSVRGLIIVAVPSIGLAIAILLPATMFLDDLVGLVLLLGVYGSSMYGDPIPAILINRPVLGALLLVTQMVIGFIIWTSFKNRHTEYQT